jgi:hypothetical protein
VTSLRYSSHSCFLLRRKWHRSGAASHNPRLCSTDRQPSGRLWSSLVVLGHPSTAHRRPGVASSGRHPGAVRSAVKNGADLEGDVN